MRASAPGLITRAPASECVRPFRHRQRRKNSTFHVPSSTQNTSPGSCGNRNEKREGCNHGGSCAETPLSCGGDCADAEPVPGENTEGWWDVA